MAITEGVNLPGRPPARTATTNLKGSPPRSAPPQPRSGTTGGKQLGLSSAHAAGSAQDRRGRRRQLSVCPAGRSGFLSGARARQNRGPRVPPRLLPPGAAVGGGPAPCGTCLPGALPRGPAPTPPGRQLSSRRPGNRRLSVTWGGAANHGRGGRGASWEEQWEFGNSGGDSPGAEGSEAAAGGRRLRVGVSGPSLHRGRSFVRSFPAAGPGLRSQRRA